MRLLVLCRKLQGFHIDIGSATAVVIMFLTTLVPIAACLIETNGSLVSIWTSISGTFFIAMIAMTTKACSAAT